ncbi:MAG TPA: RNA-binding domain-containing protein [Mycobacteriales bacterium]|nr:RNA-binding domain-containing protein [Mycobacteriales bacterium]
MSIDEAAFEAEIVEWLTARGGYSPGGRSHFDAVRGLDTAVLFEFIGATQAGAWERLTRQHGDPNEAQRAFTDRLSKELSSRGTVDVLRRGVVDRGVTIRLAYFRPAHGLTPALVQRYDANRLTVTRQLPFDPESGKTVDLALFVNGLPVATAELKNQLTGQTIADAKAQYRSTRDAANLTLARRAVVHFAVDTERVAMTTRLAGAETAFLPFDRGHDGAAGNPANPDGHRTAYLWCEVWARDNWLDLLQRFIHVERPPKGSKRPATVIFPRYHQWDAVRALDAAARAEGPGHDYLIQHSAGSGKSNTIAWLAHRLSTLHGADDRPVFDKVVVITDRRVLDRQLQDTIYQLEHAHGVVQKIDDSSAQLAQALAGAQARIIITTLQKFPVVMQQGVRLADRRYAVIVDEAHSSQTGESAKDLKLVLGSGDSGSTAPTAEQQLDAAETAEAAAAGAGAEPVADALAAAARARGRQPNISFFAFTATPKGRTLEQFGRLNPATGRHEAFHSYTMRQAIEEKFILDVLANYVTYQTYWNIEKTVREDPAYDTSRARTAIARFVSLHEHNLAQKAAVIIEHFHRHVQHKIGGQAKAMVVTASRPHAVRYQQALTEYCREHGYGIGVLVAFSGTVVDGAAEWTESTLNSQANGGDLVPESRTAEIFAEDGWHVLVVAEKYQTGFDQPLLYAMYVDKTLTGLAAVQTLSRLNRTCEGKEGTFILDFRNDADDIRESFAPWYTTTVAPPTDPNLLYDTRRALDPYDMLRGDEVERTVALIVGASSPTSPGTPSSSGKPGAHGQVHAALTPTIDRFHTLGEDDQDAFRDRLNRFVRMYSFLSQVVSFTDVGLERDYVFCKALAAFIRPAPDTGLDLGSAVELSHLRVEETFIGSLALDAGHGEVTTIFSGTGRQEQPDEEPLSQIIATLNERFGTSFGPEDRLFYDVIASKLARQPAIQQAAAVNTPENFKIVLTKAFVQQLVEQMSIAEDMSLKLLDNGDIQDQVLSAYLPLIQARATVGWQAACPIGELLGSDKESEYLEYKSTLRTRLDTGATYKPLETASLKTIAAFANSRYGGTLLIGVSDDGSVCGLATDYASLHTAGKDDRDLFQLHLTNIASAAMGDAAVTNLSARLYTIDGADVCRVHVHPSAVPVQAKVTVDRNGQMVRKTAFFVRVGNSTKDFDEAERAKYILGRWPTSIT